MRLASFLLSAALIALPVSASARTIVLSNDDGLTSNVVALYRALKAAGHDVIVSVPCTNQSGQGAALKIGQPLLPLTDSCLNDAAKAGDPGAGSMTRGDVPAADFFYANGTPIMALMYGIDVIGQERWGAAPDLVLSGPNEGQNVGAIVISSGTVSNAQFAAMRGIPAVALSAGANTEGADLGNPLSADVAQRTLELIAALEEGARGGALLPRGLALNVNFPDQLDDAKWRVTQIGSYNAYKLAFTPNLASNPSSTLAAMAAARGVEIPAAPGVSFDINEAQPSAEQMHDESVVFRHHIAVSPMQPGYAFSPAGADFVRWQLADLFSDAEEK